MLGRSRTSYLVVAAALTVLFLVYTNLQWTTTTTGTKAAPRPRPAPATNTNTAGPALTACPPELKGLELTQKFRYRRRCLRARPTEGLVREEGRSMQTVAAALLPPAERAVEIERATCEALPACDEVLEIPVPAWTPPAEVDTSALIVGAATTAARLVDSLPYMARWLRGSATHLVVVLPDADVRDATTMGALRDALARHAVNATLVPDPDAGDGQAQMHFEILRALHQHKTPAHRWFAVIDDDTFFPSLPRLLDALARYDPSQRWYVGAISENWGQVVRHGYQAIGGAGVLLSLPLLDELVSHFDACKTGRPEGDVMILDCVNRHTRPHVPLTILPGLQQLDVWGNPDGVYEAGLHPLLSLHHYRSWHTFPVHLAHLVADACGPDCFLERYHFTADDAVLSNGYSVAVYPDGTKGVDFVLMERTMRSAEEGQYENAWGVMRAPLEQPGQKCSWRLAAAAKAGDAGVAVRSWYVRGWVEGGEEGKRRRGRRDGEAVGEQQGEQQGEGAKGEQREEQKQGEQQQQQQQQGGEKELDEVLEVVWLP